MLEMIPGELTYKQIKQITLQFIKLSISEASKKAVEKNRVTLEKLIQAGGVYYGINTGFGKLANIKISDDEIELLQKNLVLSHATGIGSLLPAEIVRLILALKINSLIQACSGVRYELIESLLRLYNGNCLPCVPAKGSVGASGDLAPLAHLSLTLLGLGRCHFNDELMLAKKALELLKQPPLNLTAKEGLGLINGTQVSTAITLYAAMNIEKLFYMALISGILSLEAFGGNPQAYDARIHQIKHHTGQQYVAKIIRQLLTDSKMERSGKLQDPYSFRCQPQVMGACWDQLTQVLKVLINEANSVSDNPLVIDEDILSGGNFHAEYIAMAADNLAIVLSEIAALSERRIALLMDENFSRLPAFLAKFPGIESGFMNAQVSAAALVSENKMLAHPASVDSIPTSANQEDHVSMATHAAYRLLTMIDNTMYVLAIELLSAAQGIEYRNTKQLGPILQETYDLIRALVPTHSIDRILADEIEIVFQAIKQDKFDKIIDKLSE